MKNIIPRHLTLGGTITQFLIRLPPVATFIEILGTNEDHHINADLPKMPTLGCYKCNHSLADSSQNFCPRCGTNKRKEQ